MLDSVLGNKVNTPAVVENKEEKNSITTKVNDFFQKVKKTIADHPIVAVGTVLLVMVCCKFSLSVMIFITVLLGAAAAFSYARSKKWV